MAAERAPDTISLASLNIHKLGLRWRERWPVLLAGLVAELPDVLLLQEAARFAPQSRWIAHKLSRTEPHSRYRAVTTAKLGWRSMIEGLAVVTRLPVCDTAMLDLGGDARVAQRVTLASRAGTLFDVYNVHLSHREEREPLRLIQVNRLLDWAGARAHVPAIIAGDFNARPESAPIQAMLKTWRSAHTVVHGGEPGFTAPSWSGAGEGQVVDYIFVGDDVAVLTCAVAFGPVERAGHLVFPSDHLGLVANLHIG